MALSKFSQAINNTHKKWTRELKMHHGPRLEFAFNANKSDNIRCEHIYIPSSPGKVPMFNMGAIWAPEMAKSIFYIHPIQIDLSITIYVLWKSNWPMAILLVKHLWPIINHIFLFKNFSFCKLCYVKWNLTNGLVIYLHFIYSANGIINLNKLHSWKETIYLQPRESHQH